MATRQTLYARLGIARRVLAESGFDEAAYRAHLAEHGAREHRGRPSASTMSFGQLEAALAALEQRAGLPTSAGGIRARCHRERAGQWGKLLALWGRLADAGAVRRRGEAALLAWAKRHIRASRPEWASAADLTRCIEALKDWAARAGIDLEVQDES